ncbi:unnamed protein product [Rotaria sp. Silwood2]|nr:unnamed protein product [Rotaria sp. Silwood2]CAF2588868.1 unnamed protein product [Rotaria sp. Silwood2]CAF2853627.1 unnamed protein product [Rotaria sp. Silwood2]CAF3000839.1 unnamed protein product [Rotaria sp. Silwood2]CAF3926445.1 unnamed protein product [Rotaria sp. Silwood2]
MLNDVESKFPHSQSISFRLKPATPTLPLLPEDNNNNKIFKSEIYFNPTLNEKINLLEPKLHADLSYCYLTDADMSIVINDIIIDKKCTELWLHGNNITSRGAAILSSSLINNSKLKSLDLSFNSISDTGVYSLSQALLPNKNSSLKILYLSKNNISNDGVIYLSEMLKTNYTLKELWLSHNGIDDEGVKKLAHVLAYYNKTLKTLSLSMNMLITNASIDYLIEMFEHNRTLKHIWIKDCNLSEQGKMKLRQKANQKRNLKIEL